MLLGRSFRGFLEVFCGGGRFSGSFSSSSESESMIGFRGMLMVVVKKKNLKVSVLMVVVKRKRLKVPQLLVRLIMPHLLAHLIVPHLLVPHPVLTELVKLLKMKTERKNTLNSFHPAMPGRYRCPCGSDLPTLKGLRSHQTQSRDCRARATRAKAAVSTSSSEDELEGPYHLEPTPPPIEPMQLSDNEYQAENINLGSPLPPDPPVIQDSDEETIPTVTSQKRAYVEDEDEDESEPAEADSVYIQEFPAHLRAGEKKGEIQTQFETLRERQKAKGLEPWSPFPSEDEWELTRWLVESGASQSKIDSFMKLEMVCTSGTNDNL